MKKLMMTIVAAVALLSGAARAGAATSAQVQTGNVAASIAQSAEVTEAQARAVAGNFVAMDSIGRSVLAGRTVDTVTQRGGLYLVTLKPSGHLFVSVNRSAEPIPVFSENDFVEPEAGSPDAAIMANVESNSIAATGSAYESKWRTLLGQKRVQLATSSAFVAENIGPLLPTTWNQCSPYTDFAPVNTTSGSHMPNGCVAVAYSQIMRYWCWPEKVEEDWSFSHLADSTPGYDQQMKAGTEIDWSAMLGDYVTGIKQVTKSNTLQLGLGQILASIITEMKFQKEAGGAELSRYSQNPWYTLPRSINNLSDSDGTYEERYQWARESIIKKIPMMIGIDVGTTGHAIVGDGWMESTETDGKIHLNYGWGGGSNDKWVSFASSGIKSYMLDCVPRPMVIAEPTPVESALPLTVKWLFPTKGYEDTLNGFSIAYAKVLDETRTFEDDFSNTKGAVRGSHISVRTLSGCGEDSPLLAIGTDVNVDRNTFTWPSVFVGANSKLTFKYRSDHALNMSVLIEAFDANTSWQQLKKLELSDADASEWQDITIDLAGYANKAVAFRVRATRPSAKAANYSGQEYFGVQIDNWKITNVHSLEAAKTVSAAKSVRSYTFEDGTLDFGETYVFTITPDVADGEASVSSCSKVVASPADKAQIWGVQSIHSGDSQFSEGLYRECFLGTNQFAVYASDTTTDLKAYLSNLALMDQTKVLDTVDNKTWLTVSTNVSVSNSLKVEKAANGKFLVTLDLSHLSSAAKNANEMVTLVASDALGNVDRKYVMLHFSKIGNEKAITKEEIPAFGGTIPSEEEEEEESTEEPSEDPTDDPTEEPGDDPTEDPGEDPEEDTDEPSGGDSPIVDPTDGNANDFTEGGVNYRFCNGVDKTSGYEDVSRVGYYAYQAPAAYSLVLWWADAYKTLTSAYPTGYAAPDTSSFPNDGSITTYPDLAVKVFKEAMSTALPTDAERAAFFPTVAYTSAQWCGDTSGDAAVKAAGRRIFAMLNKGPIGILIPTSSSRSYGGVIWGCKYDCDDDGEYATVIYFTSSKSNGDNLENATLANVTVSGVGTMPGLKGFNSSGGVIETYYPIIGPANTQPDDESAPAIEGGDDKGTVVVEDEKVVVTPRENVTEITILNLGENQVEIPPSVTRIGGVADSAKIVIRQSFGENKSVDLTALMKLTPSASGFDVSLDATKGNVTVDVDGESIRLEPEFASGDGETPLEVQDGTLVFNVKSIPGLKYQVLTSESLAPDSFVPVGEEREATGTRRELSVTRSGETKGFFKVQVSR